MVFCWVVLRKENFSIKGSIKFNCNLGLTATGVDIWSSKLSYILKQKFGFLKRVDKGWITTVKDLESWRFER